MAISLYSAGVDRLYFGNRRYILSFSILPIACVFCFVGDIEGITIFPHSSKPAGGDALA